MSNSKLLQLMGLPISGRRKEENIIRMIPQLNPPLPNEEFNWDAVYRRVKCHPEEVLQCDVEYNWLPLKFVLLSHKIYKNAAIIPPTKILSEMLRAGGVEAIEKLHLSDPDLFTFHHPEDTDYTTNENVIFSHYLIHQAVQSDPIDVVKALIEYFPQGLSHKDNQRGFIPLHYACLRQQPDLIRFCIDIGISQNVGGSNGGAGGLFVKGYYSGASGDKTTTTQVNPLELVIHQLKLRSCYDDDSSWDCLMICLQALDVAMNCNDNDDEILGEGVLYKKQERQKRQRKRLGDDPVIHGGGAIGYLPPDILECIVKRCEQDLLQTDRSGRTAVVRAIHAAANLENGKLKDLFQTLLCIKYGGLKAAFVRDYRGRLPLHVAIERGLLLTGGLEQILKANFYALEEKDNVTALFPFMLAAVGENNTLDVVFELLKNNPTLVRLGV